MMSNTRPKAVVLDGYTTNPGDLCWDELSTLVELTVHERTPPTEVVARGTGATILLTNKTPISREAITALPELRLITVLATGYNIVDTTAARERGITVCNVPTYSTNSVAQHTIALLLELCHRCGDHSVAVHAGEWGKREDFCFWKSPLVELAGRTLGIAGYGRIGRRVASIAEAFGMKVQYFSRHQQATGQKGEATFVDWEEWLATSDFLSLHCTLTPKTEKMINRDALRMMKPGAFLVNTSRGALLDEIAVREALEEGRLGGLAVDVLTQEPPRNDNPLIGAPRAIITPHFAWTSIEARRHLLTTTRQNIAAFLTGAPQNVVNPR